MRKGVTGRLWSIDFRGYCPAGWPVRLAEMFVPDGGSRPPAEILGVRHTLGSGYGLTCQHVAPPPRQIGQGNLAVRRQKRAARRIEKAAPLFAEQFLAEELATRPDYYAGVTDPEIAARHDAVLAAEGRRYEELLSRPNRLVVLAEEPEAAREKAARIRAELAARGCVGRKVDVVDAVDTDGHGRARTDTDGESEEGQMAQIYPGLGRAVMAVGEYAMLNEVVRAAEVLHQALVMGCEVDALPAGVVRAGEELSLVLEAWEHRAVDLFDADARARGRMELVRSGALGCGSGSGWCDCTPGVD